MKNKKYLIDLIKSIITLRQPPEKSEDVSFEEVFKIAKSHGVANLVYYGVEKLQNKPDENLMQAWKKEYSLGLAKDIKQKSELLLLSTLFENEGIKYIPLKGFELKKLYPKSDMRQMADLDILILEEDREKVKNIMLKLGYSVECYGEGKDDSYLKGLFLHIEVHNNLFDLEDKLYYEYFYDLSTFKKANFKTKYSATFSNEDNYLYNFVHMEKHFGSYGTGIRSVMDFWLYKEKFKDSLDWEYIDQSLKNLKLEKFHSIFSDLADSWFKEEKSEPLLEELGEYILNAGSYGTKKEQLVNTNTKSKSKNGNLGKLKIVFRMLFPSREVMKTRYPILKKREYLLPLYHFSRIVSILLFRRKGKASMVGDVLKVDKDNINKREQFFKDIGLDDLYKIKR